MANIALRVRNLIKYIHVPSTFQVLKGFSFDINSGEYLSLLGKSGSGKSTLIYILSTLDTDYEGSVEMNGMLLTRKSQSVLTSFRNEHMGLVFQSPCFLPEFSVLQNVMLPALKLGKFSPQEIEAKAYYYLTLVDIEEQSLYKITRLSGGQLQRAAIARALINEPHIILADEPAGNLDSKNTFAVQELLVTLVKEFGQTIFCVTHDSTFASSSDRVIELSDGMLRE